MLRRRALIALSALALALAPAAPALGKYAGPKPTFRTEMSYFVCNGGFRVQQTTLTDVIAWDLTPPAGPFPQSGCLASDPNLVATGGGPQKNAYDAVFSGTFRGNLRAMTVRLYGYVGPGVRTTPTLSLKVRLTIENQALFAGAADAKTVVVTPKPTGTDGLEYVEFSITNLGYATYVYQDGELVDVRRGGLATENGNGAEERTIMVSVDTDSDPTQGLWLLDASDAPAGITFNPATLAAATVVSPLPAGS